MYVSTTEIIIDQDLPRGGGGGGEEDHFQGGGGGRLPPLHPLKKLCMECVSPVEQVFISQIITLVLWLVCALNAFVITIVHTLYYRHDVRAWQCISLAKNR